MRPNKPFAVGDLVFTHWDVGSEGDHGLLAQISDSQACGEQFPYLVLWFRYDGKPCFPPLKVWYNDSEFTNESG